MKIESVLVTGTSSGLGRALLDLYAKSGVKVISVNRRRLPELEALYPRVRFECVDVRSAEEVERSFACECGDPACTARVETTVGRAAAGPVLEPGHER